MNAIVLDRFRGKPAEDLIEVLSKATTQGDTPILINKEEVVGTLLSPGATKDLLTSRLLRRLETTPEVVDQLRNRITSDPIVE